MGMISHCCHAPVVEGTRKEYPLGGTVWFESYKIDVCDKCGKECEAIAEEE